MNLFELFVKVGVDDQASGKLKDLGGKLGNGLKTAAKIGTAAVATAAAGITALTTAAVKNYAEYEQLVGGVDTLFKGASQKVQEYAANAYKTTGMSANEYMENATAFSASLINSLGGDTEAAAEYANRAMVSMSDNANKMGTSIDSIVQTYQSLSRGNFGMLDNLKLGYGGTKAELERLLKDAASYTDVQREMGITVDATSTSFDNIVNAIAVVQGKMGIAGATAAEAGTTIEGSVNAMKGAWTNLITGLADGSADIGGLIDNLVTTIVGDGTENNLGVIGNVLPAIERALGGIVQLIAGAAPKIIEIFPGLVEQVVPPLITAAMDMVNAVIAVVPDLLNTVVDAIVTNAPALITAAISLVQSLIQGIQDNYQILVDGAIQIVTQLATGILNMLPKIVALGLDLIVSLANGIAESLPELIPTIVDVVLQIVNTLTNPETLSNLIDAAIAIIMSLADGIIVALPTLIDQIPVIIDNLIVAITENLPKMIEMGIKLTVQLAAGLIKAIPQLVSKIPQIINSLVEGFAGLSAKMAAVGLDLIKGIWAGISDASAWLWDRIKAWSGSLIYKVKDFFGIHSPSTLFRDEIGKNIALGLAKGIDENKDKATRAAADLAEKVYKESKEWLDRNTKYQKFTLEQQLEVWEAIQGQFVEGSKQWLDAEEEIFDLREKIQEEAIKAEEKARSDHFKKEQKKLDRRIKSENLSLTEQLKEWNRIQAKFAKGTEEYAEAEEKIFDLRIAIRDDFARKIQEIFEKIGDAEQNYQDKLQSTTDGIADSFGLFQQVEKGEALDGQQLLKNMGDQVGAIERFYGAIDQLSERGVSDALVDEIRDMGIGAADELYALLRLSDKQLTQFDDLFAKKLSLAAEIAEDELSEIRETTDAGIVEGLREISDLKQQAAPYSEGYEITEEAVEFAQSGLGTASAGIVNGVSSQLYDANGQTVEISLVLPDGTPLASYLLDPLVRFAKANGTPILNPI